MTRRALPWVIPPLLGTLALATGCAAILGYEEGYKLAGPDAGADVNVGDVGASDDGPREAGAFGDAIELARDQSPSSIGVDDANVYATNGATGVVTRYPKDGSASKALASGQFSPAWLHVTSTHLLWARTQPLAVCDTTKYPPGTTTIYSLAKTAPDGTAPGGAVGSSSCVHTGVFAFDGVAYYEFRYTNGGNGSDVVRSSGGATVSLAAGQAGVVAIASTGGTVYWAQSNAGSITKFPLPAGPAVPFALNLAGPRFIAVDDTSVYYVTDGGDVGKLDHDKPTQPPVILASGQKLPVRLVLDATHVYFTNKGDGTVRSVPKAGGEVKTLASGQLEPGAIAVDATGVYWGTGGDGAIRMVRR